MQGQYEIFFIFFFFCNFTAPTHSQRLREPARHVREVLSQIKKKPAVTSPALLTGKRPVGRGDG